MVKIIYYRLYGRPDVEFFEDNWIPIVEYLVDSQAHEIY